MNEPISATELTEYLTMREKTPENIRLAARINAAANRDPVLRDRINALETLYDALTVDPVRRRAFLRAVESEGTRESEREVF